MKMIPEGWSYNSLDKYAEVIDCKHRTPPYVEKGVPVVSPGSIKWGEIDLITPTKRVTQEEHKKLMDHCTVDIGDLVLSRNQSIGVASYVVCNKPFVLGQDTVLIKPKKSSSSFLFYCLQSEDTQRTIYKLAGGSTFSRINLKDIRNLKILRAPLSEQKKIAKILSTWDKAINVTEKIIKNSKAQKKALIQQLLTEKNRLIGSNKDWKPVKFEEILKIEIGGTPSRSNPDYWDVKKLTSNRWLSIRDMKGKTISDTKEYISDLGIKNSNVTLIPANTIVMSFKLTIGRTAILSKDCYTNEAICALIPKNKNELLVDYLFQALSIVNFDIEIDPAVKGKTLNKAKIKRLKLNLPEYKEQQKISSILSSADKEIELLQQKYDFLVQEKKALMQQLLTGKRRVKVDKETN